MDEIDLSHLLENEDMLLKAVGLSYLAVGLYFGMKTKPITGRRPAAPTAPVVQPRSTARSLSEMISKMIEETYGIEE
jgi:hypothetical protein